MAHKTIRKIIEIDRGKCDGCGLCVSACHEGAIGIVHGKAMLLSDTYCDGLGSCLPVCLAGAIMFVEREAEDYDESATTELRLRVKPAMTQGEPAMTQEVTGVTSSAAQSELRQWPIQIKLLSQGAPYFDGADLLISADCAAYARAAFHSEFMRGRITLIGCPKLDGVDYTDKLSEIIKNHDIHSLTVVHMEVPCCTGIKQAALTAVQDSGKPIPCRDVTIATDGRIVGDSGA